MSAVSVRAGLVRGQRRRQATGGDEHIVDRRAVAARGLNFQFSEVMRGFDQRAVAFVARSGRGGALPIYLGSSQGAAKEWRAAGEGDLVLTNSRLLFVGRELQVAVKCPDLIGVQGMRDGVALSTARRQAPLTFGVKNGVLWAEAVRLMARLRLEENANPQDVNVAPAQRLSSLKCSGTSTLREFLDARG
jgi:hypothetical protein